VDQCARQRAGEQAKRQHRKARPSGEDRPAGAAGRGADHQPLEGPRHLPQGEAREQPHPLASEKTAERADAKAPQHRPEPGTSEQPERADQCGQDQDLLTIFAVLWAASGGLFHRAVKARHG
jgi:hypothetical protein